MTRELVRRPIGAVRVLAPDGIAQAWSVAEVLRCLA
jgi:hypothetical protein